MRPLAEALQSNRVEVWYDEFSLKPGDSLRRSIDLGLRKSRYGIVVLSKPFFEKQWTDWELNGLVQQQLSSNKKLILPIWHGVDRKTVLDYSPSLADIVAIQSDLGLEAVVAKLLQVLFPEGSTLLIARDSLLARGVEPPVVTDDWWLDVVESSWNQWERRWHFPIWNVVPDGSHRGQLLAWQALQKMWQDEIESRAITQITRPKFVLEFIDTQPGLADVCAQFPSGLLEYAPQLAIPGFGGRWETLFDKLLDQSVVKSLAQREANSTFGSATTTDGRSPLCDDTLALRHPSFGNYQPAHIACGFVQGNGAGFGPRVRAFDYFDYLIWLFSKESNWLPKTHHKVLIEGMMDWAAWLWMELGNNTGNEFFKPNADTGRFSAQLYKAEEAGGWTKFRLTASARADLKNRIWASRELLCLPEPTEKLVELFIESRSVEGWFRRGRKGFRRRSKTKKTR